MPKAIDDYETLLTRNKIWLERTEGIGLLSAADYEKFVAEEGGH